MSDFLDEHLVGFESMADIEEATPGCFEREFTDIYGNELLHQQIGDGSEAYEKNLGNHRRKKPKKISSGLRSVTLLVPPTHMR